MFSGLRPAGAAPISPQVLVQSTCEVPGTVVEIALKVDGVSGTIVAGQFSLQYDAGAFRYIGLEPGQSCDPSSPFSTRIFASVDQSAGKVFAAVGIDLGEDPHVLGGPVTIACLRLLPMVLSSTDVCLMADAQPRTTKFLDGTGAPHSIPGIIDPAPGELAIDIACVVVEVDENCTCTPGGNECAALNTTCRNGVCDEGAGVCLIVSINENGPCDDANACTTRDVCESGQCMGHDCANPSICLVPHQCGRPGDRMQAAVRLGASDLNISGGQFSIQYDPSGLQLVSIAPGSACDAMSPFTTALGSSVNESSGEIFYAVGVGLGDQPTTGPAVLACLTFIVLDRSRSQVCTFLDVNPFNTYLVDEHGQIIQPFNGEDCPMEVPFPYTSCVEHSFCPIPAASAWGLLVMALCLATLVKLSSIRRRSA
jgi:hypothetical protein